MFEGVVEFQGLSEVSGAIEADGVVAEVEVGEHLVLDEILGQFPSPLIADLIIGEIEFHQRSVERQPREDEFKQLIINQVPSEVQDELHRSLFTRFCASFNVSAISLASVNFIPTIFFL